MKSRGVKALALAVAVGVASCAHTKVDVGGADVADLSDPDDAEHLDVAWEWQPTRFATDGAAIPPLQNEWRALAANSLVEPRGGQGLSLVWYRTRMTLKDEHAGHRVLIGMSVDDYGEVLVDGDVKALANGFNGEVVAEVTPSAVIGQVHEIVVLGVNAPLGAPPARPVFSNEVFIRKPIRLILDGSTPAPRSTTLTDGVIEPARICAVHVEREVLRPVVKDLDERCVPAAAQGPRWLRYEITVRDSAMLRVVSSGYAEVWINGNFLPKLVRGSQWTYLEAGRSNVDVLAWPAPFAGPAQSSEVTVAVVP